MENYPMGNPATKGMENYPIGNPAMPMRSGPNKDWVTLFQEAVKSAENPALAMRSGLSKTLVTAFRVAVE